MTIHPFKATMPNLELIASPDFFFGEVRENYPELLRSGFFSHLDETALFIYRYDGPIRSHFGIVAAADVEDYLTGSIVKHEHTLADKEQKMLQLVLQRQAQVKPVLLAYPEVDKINRFIDKAMSAEPPMLTVSYKGESHHFWKIADEKPLKKISKLFRKHVHKAYIADGHHRMATAALMHHQTLKKKKPRQNEHYSYALAAFFPSNQLEIHDFNRVVTYDENLSLARLMGKIGEKADIVTLDAPAKPARKHEMTMLLDGYWFRLEWKPGTLEKYHSKADRLDVSLLNKELLEDIFGIANVRTDQRVHYLPGTDGLDALAELAEKWDHAVAFALYPVQMEDFIQISDEHDTLPPKSTWFEPRINNGFLVYDFERNER
jgi:uncharacterized protein (DUF1015 family)